ncbi:MAG: ABC transporter permease [Deltaproteobacteria bacterium]|nr:ABC transporter permease [Deltaproteobacteria bacterium]
MRSLQAMIRKEFVHIARDPQLIGFVIGLPILLLVLFGYALRLRPDNLTVAVWDREKSFFSVSVKDRLADEGKLKVVEVDSEETIRAWLKDGRARLGLVIPTGFSQRLADNQQTPFGLLVDGSMPTLAQAGLFGARVLTGEEASEALRFDDPDHPTPPTRKPPIKIVEEILFNPELRDSDFFLPGTIGIVIMLVTLTLSSGLVREKEQQTIEQLLVTPISPGALIIGKMLPYGFIAALDFVVAVVLARVVFALPFRGSVLGVVVLAALFILALLALGALISTLSETQIQANFMAVFVIVPSVLMSGFVFPIEAMPYWLRPVAWSLPMTYFVEASRGLTLKGASIAELGRDFAALVTFVVVLGAVSVVRFRKTLS